jgi:hypothetical protein
MDHIFEHEGQEIPKDQDKAPAASSSTAGAGGAMDVDEEEGEAGLGQDLEAKVCPNLVEGVKSALDFALDRVWRGSRASSARNVARYSGIRLSLIFTRRRAGMINLRSLLRMSAN